MQVGQSHQCPRHFVISTVGITNLSFTLNSLGNRFTQLGVQHDQHVHRDGIRCRAQNPRNHVLHLAHRQASF